MLWGNTACCAKLSGEDLSRYSNKIKSVGSRNVRIITILLRKWCHNSKYFSELAPHHGGKNSWHTYRTQKLRHCHPMKLEDFLYLCPPPSIRNTDIPMCISVFLTLGLFTVKRTESPVDSLSSPIRVEIRIKVIFCTHATGVHYSPRVVVGCFLSSILHCGGLGGSGVRGHT